MDRTLVIANSYEMFVAVQFPPACDELDKLPYQNFWVEGLRSDLHHLISRTPVNIPELREQGCKWVQEVSNGGRWKRRESRYPLTSLGIRFFGGFKCDGLELARVDFVG